MEEKNKNTKNKTADLTSPEITRGKSLTALREEEILEFWQENKIFEKSLEKESPKGEFVFYDGPPFATGLPHYGHILPGTIKDIIPRYKTMSGFHVRRTWGWDCHGLPVENLVEKELGLSSKKDIEKYGVKKFNAVARETVMRYTGEWKKIIPRMGRWVDMENSYKTMDSTYTESVWWAFKNLYDKGLVYQNFKSMHLCPHCETTLSNFEVNQGYKDIADISVYVKFKLIDEDNTYLLAWTTTPWTLPGNVALAVNKDFEYAKVRVQYPSKISSGSDRGQYKPNDEYFYISSDILHKYNKSPAGGFMFPPNEGIVFFPESSIKGKDLVGRSYKPLFPYYDNDKLENRERGFKIYHGDFVTTVDGTGVVHIAPAFGEDDMILGEKEKLPFIQHVNIDGTFKKEVTDFAGQMVKPKDDPNGSGQEHQNADVEVIKFLAKEGSLFDKEKIVHSYPHCWRCDTPLLNYATTSWFVKVTNLKDKLVENNNKVSWHPKEIGEGRFGNWLSGARDWAISRSRYWGAPLPVWENENKERKVVGSIADLKKYAKKSGNKYFVMRHGEAEQNIGDFINADIKNVFRLTEEGKKQVAIATTDIKSKKIDLIISSPFERCKETAKIVQEILDLKDEEVLFDERVGELQTGNQYEGKTWSDYIKFFADESERFTKSPEGGETLLELSKRIGDFLYDLEKKYSNKNILIVSHGAPIIAMHSISDGSDFKTAVEVKKRDGFNSGFAEFSDLDFSPLPHDENFLLDLHKPFIDEIELIDEKGNSLKRVPEVFDCWLESGSMPFAQSHYPFENKEEFEKKGGQLFPAEFIAEGLDQTRGWFYTMMILGTGLFERSPYNNVIVNGLVLAEDGRKMSKSLNNYPDIMYIVDKYGADALRYYLMASPAVRAEDLNFSEKGVDEVSKKVILKLGNVLSFYKMYSNDGNVDREYANKSKNILDKWILIKFSELGKEITSSLENYQIDSATRPILNFIDDLSVWYIRRSRDRFKSENFNNQKEVLAATNFVLINFAKYLAPFAPFLAENIYLSLKTESDPESVHLCSWVDPVEIGKEEKEILENMEEVRKVVSLALEKRMSAGIKVRQPLNELKIKSQKLKDGEEYLELIKDEVNVKNISFDEKLETEVELDIEITEELKREGDARDFVRAVQELRKNKKLLPKDEIILLVATDNNGENFVNSVSADIKKPTNISEIVFESNDGEEISIGEIKLKLKIK